MRGRKLHFDGMAQNDGITGISMVTLFPIFLCLFVTIQVISCTPTNLRVEYLAEDLAIGIDVHAPRFTWEHVAMPGERVAPADVQSSYNINVENALTGVTVWSSGMVPGTALAAVYDKTAATSLTSDTVYTWSVSTTDGTGKVSRATSLFHTGFFGGSNLARQGEGEGQGQQEWTASWIVGYEGNGMLRKAFSVKPNLVRATAFTSVAGYHEFYLNGKKVGNRVLDVVRSDCTSIRNLNFA